MVEVTNTTFCFLHEEKDLCQILSPHSRMDKLIAGTHRASTGFDHEKNRKGWMCFHEAPL